MTAKRRAPKKATSNAKKKTQRKASKTIKSSRPALKDAAQALRIVAPVWDRPDDDDLKQVVADALLEQGDPWGEFITLQLRIAQKKATPADKKRAATIERQHRDIIAGPIAKVASKKGFICEKGFLVECMPERRLVPRPDWEAAARAPHWATVRTAVLSLLTTPHWWITEWMKNPATRNLRSVLVSNLVIEREPLPTKPWRVMKAARHKFYGSILAAFAKGLRPEEQARLVIAPSIAESHREMLEAALAKAGVKRA